MEGEMYVHISSTDAWLNDGWIDRWMEGGKKGERERGREGGRV